MSPIKACVALVTLLAAASFASSQEVADQAPAPATPVAEEAPAVATPGAEQAISGDVVIAAADTAAPVTVVDAAELIAREPPPVVCREILKQGSNVHILQCMTAENWRIFERAEALNAASIVRMMQGRAYR